ncbi:hypothetical protein AB0K18_09740 [Nonomuraea sp. NPDC049421]|uniref:hypothetical protein n=1 Tax=Nonomuraea sp. NPDC049421 TaxID=3155275 RepID=UPI003446BEF2
MDTLEGWTAPLAELRRVLVPGGRLLVSVNHPFADFLQAEPGTSYFATRSSSDEWTLGGQTAVLTFWSRPLHAMATMPGKVQEAAGQCPGASAAASDEGELRVQHPQPDQHFPGGVTTGPPDRRDHHRHGVAKPVKARSVHLPVMSRLIDHRPQEGVTRSFISARPLSRVMSGE